MRGFRGARANMAMGARRVLGGAKHAIKFLGRANNFAKGLGITNPSFNNAVGNLEKYGLPTADFLESELPAL